MSDHRSANLFLSTTIAALLAYACAPQAASQNTLPTVIVTAPGGGGGGWFGGGAGGGGGWGGVSTTAPENPEIPDPCDSILGAAGAIGCDLKNPPRLVVNGCGSSGSQWVPDGVVGYPALFTSACDAHDTCYGTWGQSKDSCDARLGSDMAMRCQSIDRSDYGARALCSSAVSVYPSALRYLPQADSAYRSAQNEAQCRELAKMSNELSCS